MEILRNCNKGLIALAVIGTLISTGSFADPVTINITGKVVASACTIDNSGTYNVDLGQTIDAALLNSATPYSAWKTFNVTLSKCPTGTSSVTATFSGTPDSTDSTMYANASGTGYASNVSVELQRVTGAANVGNGKTSTATVNASKNVTFDLQARARGKSSNAGPGNISTVVLMNFTYN